VSLKYRLKNGDIVEIVTAAGHKPSRDWLTHVVTSKARQKVRHFIHAEEKTRSVELGRKLFEKEARSYGVAQKASDDDAVASVASAFGVTRADEVFAAIGYGRLAPRQVLARLVPPEQLEAKTPESPLATVVRRVFRSGEDKIKVSGADDLLVFRARCCNPIKGERIVGYITRGKGVSVHSATCPNVLNLLYDPERRIDVEWDHVDGTAEYLVRLAIQVEDRKGILADVSAKVAAINTNITMMEAKSDERGGRIDIAVEIHDLKHLQKVVKAVKSVNGVTEVTRTAK
jgi:GTP pyrophosphokinase